MKTPKHFSKLKSIFGVERVPSDTHMRSVLDETPKESFRPIFKDLFAIAIPRVASRSCALVGRAGK